MRRRQEDTDSLDMLLDAISNTFGGVLFIAVLVVILLQFTGDSKKPKDPQAKSNSQDSKELEAMLASLSKQLEEQRGLVEQLGDPAERGLIPELVRLRKVHDLLAGAVSDAEDDAKLSGQQQTTRQTLELKLKRLQTEARRLRAMKAKKAPLPRLRETDKMEFPLVISGDRLYLLFEPDARQGVGNPRLQDFERVDPQNAPGGWVALPTGGDTTAAMKPKPTGGWPIGDEGSVKSLLGRQLRVVNPNKQYLAIGVWENSFESFSAVRNAIVELGYEYRLMPLESSDHIGSSTSARSLVQ